MSKAALINSKGYANGWHAQMLQAEAARTGVTMAGLFHQKIGTAYNVPATCTKVDSVWCYYRFADGSTARYPNQEAM